MKKLLLLLGLLLFIPVLPKAYAKAYKQKVTFYVYLHCDACISKIMKNIAYEKGVMDIECSIENQTVVVTYDANKTDIPTLQKEFEKIGKPASLTPPQGIEKQEEDKHEHHHHHHK